MTTLNLCAKFVLWQMYVQKKIKLKDREMFYVDLLSYSELYELCDEGDDRKSA